MPVREPLTPPRPHNAVRHRNNSSHIFTMSAPLQIIQSADVISKPEFGDYRTCRTLFNLSRSSLYELVAEGKIRSVSVRKRGNVRGKRLFVLDSIRTYLNSLTQAE